MGRRQYLRLLFSVAFAKPWAIVGIASFVWAIIAGLNESYRWWNPVISPTLSWVIPLVIFLAYGGWRLSVARYIMHLENKNKELAQLRARIELLESTQTTREPTLTEDFDKAKVVWGYWFAGTKIRADKVLEKEIPGRGKIKDRALLLRPDTEAFAGICQTAECPEDEVGHDIESLIKHILTLNSGIEPRVSSERRDWSLSILDSNPIVDDKGKLIPNSDNAWIVYKSLDPKVGAGERRLRRIEKREEPSVFDGFLKEFVRMWDVAAKVALDKYGVPIIVQESLE